MRWCPLEYWALILGLAICLTLGDTVQAYRVPIFNVLFLSTTQAQVNLESHMVSPPKLVRNRNQNFRAYRRPYMSFPFTNWFQSWYKKTWWYPFDYTADISKSTARQMSSPSILATVMISNEGWHRSRECWLLGECWVLRGCWLLRGCWMSLNAATVWLLILGKFC